MKVNKITLGIIACSVAASIYAYQLYDGNNLKNIDDQLTQNNKKSLEQKDDRILVTDLSNSQELFNILYLQANKNNLKDKEDLRYFNIAKNSDYNLIAYLNSKLEGYKYGGLKIYKNNGENRYLVSFTHMEAEFSNNISSGDNLDLFLFKKTENKYELIAKTVDGGFVNGNGGNSSEPDMVYNNIFNSEPVNLGSKYKGFVINSIFMGGGNTNKVASVILLDEGNKKIYDIANNISLGGSAIEDNASYEYDSFYFLDKSKENNGIYNLAVLYEGENDTRKSYKDEHKIKPYNIYKIYRFNGKKYELESEKANPYSCKINNEKCNDYFSKIDEDGYAPIFYESVLKFVDREYIDYWLGRGVRAYKPSEKTEDFFTWKIKGLKVYGLDVIGIRRGVCNISGEDACGYAGTTIIIFRDNFDKVRKTLKEKIYCDYAERNKVYPYLDSIDYDGKERAALYSKNENF